jgi:hypothetical protein
MTKQLGSVARLLVALVTLTGVVVGGAGGAAARPDRAAARAAAVRAPAQQVAKSRPVSIVVARRVPVGATVKITGAVHPAAPHQRVKLQLRSSGAWHTLRTKKLTANSTYRFKQTFATTGNRRFRVVVPRHGATHKIKSRARTVHVTTPGNDVSYPQCGGALPAGSFGIVGVDGGRPFDVNPCLAAEIAWAAGAGSPAYYVNTANPGPKKSTHWPNGQTSPQLCKSSSPNSKGCSYDYGWNAAKDSYARAAAAAVSAGAPAVSGATWWLDVESGNSWQALDRAATAIHYANDTATLQGIRAYLRAKGVRTVGVYSTTHQWQAITGGATLHKAPVWYAGVGGPSSAAAHCSAAHSFTTGPVRLTQYVTGGFDADNIC